MNTPKSFSLHKPITQLQTLKRMDMVVIRNYVHMTTMDEHTYWIKLTHLLSNFSLTLKAPFCTSSFTSKNTLVAF